MAKVNDEIDFFSFMPDELVRFVQRDTYSLLIKGFAGTGKTTLSLTILRALKGQSKFFYISTRTSPKQLFQYYPWLETFVGDHSPGKELTEEQSQVLSPNFEDARLDEPESLFERITNQLMDIKSPVIIIDSWDAIASFMDKEARLNNERVLQTWRERAGAKLIFISEHPHDTTLDFLVDGIVELKQIPYDGASLREITFHKMRGVRINRGSYLYTLEGTMFRSIPPFLPIAFAERGKEIPEINKINKSIAGDLLKGERSPQIATGYSALDNSIGGGLVSPCIVLLELSDHVTNTVAIEFLIQPIFSFLREGHSVLFEPFGSIDAAVIEQTLAPAIPEKFKTAFKVGYATSSDYGLTSGVKSRTKLDSQSKEPSRKKHARKSVIHIVGSDSLRRNKQRDTNNKADLHSLAALTRSNKGVLLAIIRSSETQSLQDFSETADLQLRLVSSNGTLMLQSIIPSPALFGVFVSLNESVLNLVQLV